MSSRRPLRVDVAVIGAGIVGCAIARELSTSRASVALVDREVDVGFGTSKANSGIIHAGHHAAPTTLKGRLEWEGNRRWEPLAAELRIGFRTVGDLTVAFDDDQVETLGELEAQARANGVTGVELWDAARLRREEPQLNPDIRAALHAPTAAVVNPYEACFALAEIASLNGVHMVLGTEIDAIDVHGDGVDERGGSGGSERGGDGFTLRSSDTTVFARAIVNAAGLGADRIERMVGLETFHLIARKGEEYLLDKRVRNLVRHIIFPCPTPTSKGILVIPTYDGTLMVGPTARDVDDRDDLDTTTAGAQEVFESVQRLVPGLSAGDCIAEFAGIRAVADTGDFVIGPTPVRGFVNAAGIQSPGLTAAPVIAELVAETVTKTLGETLSGNVSKNVGETPTGNVGENVGETPSKNVGETAAETVAETASTQVPGTVGQTIPDVIGETLRDMVAGTVMGTGTVTGTLGDESERPDVDRSRRDRPAVRIPPPMPVREMDLATRTAHVARTPGSSRIVCRCELVTEGEVIDSIERGATTIDGVKFRTRAGMGRCQGGFCTWRVMQLLADRLDVPVSAVTKRGGNSWIVIDRDDPSPDPEPDPSRVPNPDSESDPEPTANLTPDLEPERTPEPTTHRPGPRSGRHRGTHRPSRPGTRVARASGDGGTTRRG